MHIYKILLFLLWIIILKKIRLLKNVLFVVILKNYFMKKPSLYMMNIIILNYIIVFLEIISKILEIIPIFLIKIVMFGFCH